MGLIYFLEFSKKSITRFLEEQLIPIKIYVFYLSIKAYVLISGATVTVRVR